MAAPSVAANMISKLDENPTELDLLAAKSVPGTMYTAGTDTVSEVQVSPDEVHLSFFKFCHRLSPPWRYSFSP